MRKKDRKIGMKKQDVYFGSLCYVEKSGNMRNIYFLTDVVVDLKDGNYVNHFNNDEIYSISFTNDGDVFFNPTSFLSLTEDEIYYKLLDSYNYCKDLKDLISKRMSSDSFVVTSGEYDKMRRAIEQDELCRERYEKRINSSEQIKVKQKVK